MKLSVPKTYSEEVQSLMEEMTEYAALQKKENPDLPFTIPEFGYSNVVGFHR